MSEKTLVILKPDCIQRGIIGEIITRLEKKGLKFSAIKMALLTKKEAEFHYEEHKGKDFYQDLVNFITSSPVVLIVIEGDNAINLARKIAGATKSEDALPGTIRGDYVIHTSSNIIHTSDSLSSAKREINNFFDESEILKYNRDIYHWI